MATTKPPARPPRKAVARPKAAKPQRHPEFDRDDAFQRRRQVMLQTAIRLFNRDGFHATSMETIATALGLTKGTLYHYYDSKTDLAFACILESAEDGRRTAQRAHDGGGSGLEKLERYLRMQFETLAGRGGSSWLLADMSVLPAAQQAEARKRSRIMDALVQKFLVEGVRDGSIVDVDTKIAEFYLMGALNWLPRWYKPDGPMSSAELAAVFIRMTFDGLRGRKG